MMDQNPTRHVRGVAERSSTLGVQVGGHYYLYADDSLDALTGDEIVGTLSRDQIRVLVFKDLERIRIGDVIEVFSSSRTYGYRVTNVSVVSRTEVRVIDPTDDPVISLITCTGLWLPHLHDYTDRLVVRGELAT